MNIKKSITKVLIAASLTTTAFAQQKKEMVDFNQVGKEMAKMLMNRHMEQIKFDEHLSDKIFRLLIKQLDGQMRFFTQADINSLEEEYGKTIHVSLIRRSSNSVAEAVNQRIAYAQKYLKETEFDFTSERTLKRENKKKVTDPDYFTEWPANEAAAEAKWQTIVEEAVLSETLRRENVARLAEEQGKENPLKADKGIKEIILLRYQRILKAIEEEDNEDIANHLLSAVALSYGPHTDYFSAREYDRFKAGMNNQFVT